MSASQKSALLRRSALPGCLGVLINQLYYQLIIKGVIKDRHVGQDEGKNCTGQGTGWGVRTSMGAPPLQHFMHSPIWKIPGPHHSGIFMEAPWHGHEWWSHWPLVMNSISILCPTTWGWGWSSNSLIMWLFPPVIDLGDHQESPHQHKLRYDWGLPIGSSGKESAWQCRSSRRRGFDPWVGKIAWKRKWQPTPVFLSVQSHGQMSLAGYRSWGCKELYTTEHAHTCMYRYD